MKRGLTKLVSHLTNKTGSFTSDPLFADLKILGGLYNKHGWIHTCWIYELPNDLRLIILRKIQENLKVGHEHNLMLSLPSKNKNFAITQENWSPTLIIFVNWSQHILWGIVASKLFHSQYVCLGGSVFTIYYILFTDTISLQYKTAFIIFVLHGFFYSKCSSFHLITFCFFSYTLLLCCSAE